MRYAVEYLKRAHGADIARWAARGVSLKQLCRALGRQGCMAAPQTVKAVLSDLGIVLTDGRRTGRWRRGRKPETIRRRKRASAMAALRPRLTYREIGARFGITGERVRQELIAFSLAPPPSTLGPTGPSRSCPNPSRQDPTGERARHRAGGS